MDELQEIGWDLERLNEKLYLYKINHGHGHLSEIHKVENLINHAEQLINQIIGE